jgi:hypothetical protein
VNEERNVRAPDAAREAAAETLREAVCRHREITVDASCGMGKIVMVIPRGWSVDIDAASTNTGHIVNRANHPPDRDAPRLRVIGHAGSGKIRIRHPRWRR